MTHTEVLNNLILDDYPDHREHESGVREDRWNLGWVSLDETDFLIGDLGVVSVIDLLDLAEIESKVPGFVVLVNERHHGLTSFVSVTTFPSLTLISTS